MGKILIDAFIESKAVRPSKITIMNRTKKGQRDSTAA